MAQAVRVLESAHVLYTRADSSSRPPVYKAIGISLAVASGLFIGTSFVLKKVGLLKANKKYDEVAGEGYGYLKNAYWWTGMTLMIFGEICNFVAYAFVDAILVTPLGALSVVITTILSAIFLKERLSLIGKVGCFMCIIGSVVIVMNAPSESSAANIQDMQHFVIEPGFLSYAGVVIIGCAIVAIWVVPKYGKKSMLVYLSICSWIGGLSVVATQGLGAAVLAQAGGTPQFNQWFLYVLFVFVTITLVTEIIYLNVSGLYSIKELYTNKELQKALNLFNAALVTPTYYVYFTSSTIITSAILFQGFNGTPTSIITVVMGFFTICSGVVLLQLSKSAKDVPDAAVFSGDLDQVRTIAEQEQPETEPKADAIRGAAAIVRRFSLTRQKMEMEEARKLHEEKKRDLEPIGENEQYEWDGLRRRKTIVGSPRGIVSPHTPQQHPPLGMSHFPTEEELQDQERPNTGGLGSSFLGSIRSRARSMGFPGQPRNFSNESTIQSPMRPVPLTEIAIPSYKEQNSSAANYGQGESSNEYGFSGDLEGRKTAYEGSSHVQFSDPTDRLAPSSVLGLRSPPHSARRQFSFHNVFRKGQAAQSDEFVSSRALASQKGLGSRQSSDSTTKGATEEERLGLVVGDTNLTFPEYDEDEIEEDEIEEDFDQRKRLPSPPRHKDIRVVAGDSRPPRSDRERNMDSDNDEQEEERDQHRGPSPSLDGGSGGGAFI